MTEVIQHRKSTLLQGNLFPPSKSIRAALFKDGKSKPGEVLATLENSGTESSYPKDLDEKFLVPPEKQNSHVFPMTINKKKVHNVATVKTPRRGRTGRPKSRSAGESQEKERL